jgi:uncharacterized protein DUF4238
VFVTGLQRLPFIKTELSNLKRLTNASVGIDLSNMARPHKGQHKVPRTYLEAFTDESGYFWIGNNQLNIYRDKPHNVLTEKDYYTVRFPAGGGTLTIETEFLGGIETAYADVYRRKLKTRQQLNNKEKGIMAVFLASMLERSPRRRKAMRQLFKDVTANVTQVQTAIDAMSPEEYKQFVRISARIGPDNNGNSIPADEFIELGKDVPSAHSSQIPHVVSATAPILYDMKWGFMVREEDTDPFITSDNPVVVLNPSLPPNSFWGPGLMQEDVEVTIPLSSDLALLASWQVQHDLMYTPIDAVLVNELNRRLMRQSSVLICNDKSVLERQAERVRRFLQAKQA